ncbi:MAG: biotin/lipoyl-binding protein, partial [Anaerolineae bacterium]|nr:biotin/lipoyl-binding protein [Anaerolineae bacterium]
MTKKRTFFLLISAGIAVVLMAGMFQVQPVSSQAAQQPTRAATGAAPQATPTAASSASGISALGSVEAATVVSTHFQTSGTVQNVYVQLGDYVQAGEVIADLDGTDLWNTYHQAVLNVEKAQLTLDALYEPPTEDELKSAKAKIASAQANYSSIANSVSSADVQSAQLSYDQAQQRLDGLKQARANMGGTDNEIALQDAKIGEASFNAEIARLQLVAKQTPNSASLWQASVSIQQAQLNLAKLQAGPTQAEIDNAQISLQMAQANLTDAQTALRHIQLFAPRAGTITAVNISARDSVAMSVAAIEISDLTQLRITVPIN